MVGTIPCAAYVLMHLVDRIRPGLAADLKVQ